SSYYAPSPTLHSFPTRRSSDLGPSALAQHSGQWPLLLRAQLLRRGRQSAPRGRARPLRQGFRRGAGRWLAFRRAVPPREEPHPRPAVAAELRRLGWPLVMSRAKLKVPVLTLDAAQEQAAQQTIKRFLEDRFELELGSFEAQEVLDLFAREIAPLYYNKAIFDVQTHLKDRFESIESDLWALEKS